MTTDTNTATQTAPEETPVEEVISDSSTVRDQTKLTQIIGELGTVLKRGLSAHRAATTVLKQVAAHRMAARVLILDANGHPDWAAKTDTYRLSVAKAEEAIWVDATSDEKRRVDGAIRQHISRTFLEPAITEYVLASVQGMPKPGDLRWTEAKGDTPSVLSGDIPEALKKAIAAEYRAAGLQVPVKFGGPKPGSGGGTNASDPENPSGDFAAAIVAMEKLAPATATSDLLRATSALSVKVRKGEAVKDREQVEKNLVRLALVAQMTAKVIAGKATEKDVQALEAALWTAE